MSHPKGHFIVIVVRLLLLNYGITLLPGFQIVGVAAITDAQRAEVERLRSELSAAFEKHDEESVADKGVIVQPGWTQHNNSEPKETVKVVVTNDKLKEAAKLRDEISKAAAQDTVNAKSISKLELELSAKGSTKELIGKSDTVGSQLANDDIGIGGEANIITANAADVDPDIDIRKLQRLEVSKRRTREVLVLDYIEEDFAFALGEHVLEWEHVVNNGSGYFIGRRDTDMLIARKIAEQYEPSSILTIGEPIAYLESYNYWNAAAQIQEGVVLIAVGNRVRWYRIDPESGHFTEDWEWLVGTTITGLTYFTIDSRQYLTVSTNQSTRSGFYALNVFEYDLETREFWIVQRLQMRDECAEVTILDTGRDIILAVTQHNTAAIYTYNPHESGVVHFRLRHSIASESINHISGFKMGGRSYLALGGLQPQILHYQQGELQPKTILGNNFGLVELFLPIPARTYRDDLILLVQHRVEFATHAVIALETLLWNGEAFETSIPVPCKLGPHTVYGVGCMLDIQRDDGLKGAALLRRGDILSLIVPRNNAESGLFRLHTVLLAKNSELLDLQEIYAFLQEWVKEQYDLIAQAESYLAETEETKQFDTNTIEYLETPELTYNGFDIGEVLVNGQKWTDADTQMQMKTLLDDILQLKMELNNARSKREIDLFKYNFDTLDFDNVVVENLTVAQVNHVPYFVQNASISFDGILNVEDLIVLDSVQSREGRQAFIPELEIDGDLEFDEINGLRWSELEKQLVFRNQPLTLNELEVMGEVIAEAEVNVDVLNSLNFPDDYFWSNSPTTSIVTAEKVFTGTLSANAVDTDGLINGVNPIDAITLSNEQDWAGMPTFNNLEISEKLNLSGTVQGRNSWDMPTNPTLLETHILNAACSFKHLQVLGKLHINGLLDNEPLAPLLNDIVQRKSDPNEEILIMGPKEFTTVTFPVDFNVDDAAVNNISIHDFIPKHTAQTLNLLNGSLEANVYFHSLNLTSGLYDGVNITELMENAIRIDRPQYSPQTQLNFVQPINGIMAVDVMKKLNGDNIAETFQTIYEDLHIDGEAKFEHLNVDNVFLTDDIVGDGQLNGLNLRQFLAKNISQDPAVAGNIFIDELLLHEGLLTDEIHGIDTQLLLNFLENVDELPLMILDGSVLVDNVTVTGAVQVHKLNGKDFDKDILKSVIWLDRPNFLNNTLTFAEPVVFNGDLNVLGTFNEVADFPAFIDDIVFRTNEPIVITAPKNFQQNVRVYNDSRIMAIGGLPFVNIATKKHSIHFNGSLELHGNLYVKELIVNGKINNYPMSQLTQQIRYDPQMRAFILRGVTALPAQTNLMDLTVYGQLNDIPNLSEFFADLVYKSGTDCVLTGHKTFTGRVTIRNGAYIRQLNDYNLYALLNNIVFINEPHKVVEIHSPVKFRVGPIQLQEAIIHGTLRAGSLSGCQLAEWLSDTVRVDQSVDIEKHLNFAPGCLDGNALTVNYLNDIDMSQVITLYTDQNLSNVTLHFEGDVYLDGKIEVRGRVNGRYLPAEYVNTLLTNAGNQYVTTPLIMKSVIVLENLETLAPVNHDKILQDVATLRDDNLNFEAPLYFHKLRVNNVQTNDLITGIDFNRWYDNSLWLSGREQQRITGNWSIKHLKVKHGQQERDAGKSSNDSYKMLCERYVKALEEHKKLFEQGANFIKHLEERSDMKISINVDSVKSEIRKVFRIEMEKQHYLLINVFCKSLLYKWQSDVEKFLSLQTIDTGPIDELILLSNVTLKQTKQLQFITQFENFGTVEENCSNLHGFKTWRLALNNVTDVNMAVNSDMINKLKTQVETLSKRRVNSNLTTRTTVETLNRKPPNFQRASTKKYRLIRPTTVSTVLKPHVNQTQQQNFTFDDFTDVIERILNDLIYRLNGEVNITQLSIPETDLYDENFIEDFLAIMEALQKQHIVSNETFAHIDLEKLQIPSNPAQVLAMRTVQIIWPVLVEIEEIHGYLGDRYNETHNHPHPFCENVTESLVGTVSDVLELANYERGEKKLKEDFDAANVYTFQLNAVIVRIRLLQQEIEDIMELTNIVEQRRIDEAAAENAYGVIEDADSDLKRSTVRSAENSNSPFVTETLELIVGPAQQTRSLKVELTLAARPQHIIAGQYDAINIYLIGANGVVLSQFQTLYAQRPRLLVSLRIRAETLLLYVEDCCLVRVLLYRGVEGFVEFSHFETTEPIVDLFEMKLLRQLDGRNAYMFVVGVALARDIVFYEIVISGQIMELPEMLVCE